MLAYSTTFKNMWDNEHREVKIMSGIFRRHVITLNEQNVQAALACGMLRKGKDGRVRGMSQTFDQYLRAATRGGKP